MSPVPADAMAATEAPARAPDIAAIAAELVACGSLEMGADAPSDALRIAELLPAGTPVYVNHLPRRELAHTLPALLALADAGLEPVPHLAARRIGAEAEVAGFLEQAVHRARVRRVMLIGGDADRPHGPYADAGALLDAGVLADAGIGQVALAGYPEGHPRIATAVLAQALGRNLASARAQGLGVHVVTQFSFAPTRIVEYCADLARRLPDVAVYVGMPGPASPRALLAYAQRCGVGASLRALQVQGYGAIRLATQVDPTDQLTALARHCRTGGASNVVGVHLYSFGGVATTVHWMNARITAR